MTELRVWTSKPVKVDHDGDNAGVLYIFNLTDQCVAGYRRSPDDDQFVVLELPDRSRGSDDRLKDKFKRLIKEKLMANESCQRLKEIASTQGVGEDEFAILITKVIAEMACEDRRPLDGILQWSERYGYDKKKVLREIDKIDKTQLG